VGIGPPTFVIWDGQDPLVGPGVVYDFAGGTIVELLSLGPGPATECLAGDLQEPVFDDIRPDPAVLETYYFLVQARNSCGATGFEHGNVVDAQLCTGP